MNGRNSLSWEQKFELDVWYVDHWSLWLDAIDVVDDDIATVPSRGNQPARPRHHVREFMRTPKSPEAR